MSNWTRINITDRFPDVSNDNKKQAGLSNRLERLNGRNKNIHTSAAVTVASARGARSESIRIIYPERNFIQLMNETALRDTVRGLEVIAFVFSYSG